MMGKLQPKLVLYLGVLGVSASAILVRWSQAPSAITATYRLGWTVLILLPVVLLRFREELKRVCLHDLFLCALSGGCLALHFLAWFESLKWTSVASSTVLVSTEVLFTALGFALFLKGKIPPKGVVSIVLAFGGSAVLALADGAAGGALYGNLLALGAALFVALYTLIGKIQRGHLSTTIYTFFTYGACLLVLLAMDLAAGLPLTGYGSREWLIGLALAVLCTLMGHSLFSWCLKDLSPSYVSAVKLCEPIGSALLAIPLFGEYPGPVQLLGAVILLGAVFLYTKSEGENEKLSTNRT